MHSGEMVFWGVFLNFMFFVPEFLLLYLVFHSETFPLDLNGFSVM